MKILVVLSRVPFPLDRGDKLRAYNQLKYLSLNNEIYIFCLNDNPLSKYYGGKLDFITEICVANFSKKDALIGMVKSLFDLTPFQVGYYTHKKNQKLFQDYLEKIKPDVVYNQLLRTGKYIAENYPKVLDYQDCFSLNTKLKASKVPFPLNLFYLQEAKRLKKYEQTIFYKFEKCSIISENDLAVMPIIQKNEIAVISNGIANSFLTFKNHFKEEYDILFVGNMSYIPNIDAVKHLVKDIMPLVWQKDSSVKLHIVGASPTKAVKNLSSNNVKIHGRVEDVRIYYAKAKIFVAPMQIGTGIQNKILEAMALSIPVITTELCNKSLKAQNTEHLLIADTPQENANRILYLLNNPEEAQNLGQRGHDFVRKKFNWGFFSNILNSLLLNSIAIRDTNPFLSLKTDLKKVPSLKKPEKTDVDLLPLDSQIEWIQSEIHSITTNLDSTLLEFNSASFKYNKIQYQTDQIQSQLSKAQSQLSRIQSHLNKTGGEPLKIQHELRQIRYSLVNLQSKLSRLKNDLSKKHSLPNKTLYSSTSNNPEEEDNLKNSIGNISDSLKYLDKK